MMRFGATSIRRSLVVGILLVFAFARIAFAGEACSSGAGCPPLSASVAGHGHGNDRGEVCAMQTVSSQSANAATLLANAHGAVAPASVTVLIVPPAVETAHPSYSTKALDRASLLVTYRRLRL